MCLLTFVPAGATLCLATPDRVRVNKHYIAMFNTSIGLDTSGLRTLFLHWRCADMQFLGCTHRADVG